MYSKNTMANLTCLAQWFPRLSGVMTEINNLLQLQKYIPHDFTWNCKPFQV